MATDLSTQVLTTARAGVYAAQRLKFVPKTLQMKYFRRVSDDGEAKYGVIEDVKRRISFARLNLMDSWPMKGPFDVIFCRNVMIYFDKATQKELVNRFWQILAPGGTLFVGHSESLAGITHRFQYQQPTVYIKPQTACLSSVAG